MRTVHLLLSSLCVLALAVPAAPIQSQTSGSSGTPAGLQSGDLSRLRAVNDVEFSPDGKSIAYTVIMRDHPGRAYSQLWVMDVATRKSSRLGNDKSVAGAPRWSHDGRWLSYTGTDGKQGGLWIVHPDGSDATFLAPMSGSNSPLPGQGDNTTWSPDGKQIAFVSSSPGPETADATGDPVVITRYLYRPTASEGLTHFNDNRRLHIFIVDVASKQVRQLTNGTHDEHSIDWSPDGHGDRLSSRTPTRTRIEFFNYNVFAIKARGWHGPPADGDRKHASTRRSGPPTASGSPTRARAAGSPTARRQWKTRTSGSWTARAGHRREVGGPLDAREGHPRWSPDGGAIYFTAQQRGSAHLCRIAISPTGAAGHAADRRQRPRIGRRVLGRHEGHRSRTRSTTTKDLAELYVRSRRPRPRKATDSTPLSSRASRSRRSIRSRSISNDNKFEVEVVPRETARPAVEYPSDTRRRATKYPMIVEIHGGPHGQNGPGVQLPGPGLRRARAGRRCTSTTAARPATGRSSPTRYSATRTATKGRTCCTPSAPPSAAIHGSIASASGSKASATAASSATGSSPRPTSSRRLSRSPASAIIISYNYMTYYNQYEAMECGQYPAPGHADGYVAGSARRSATSPRCTRRRC